MNIHSNTTTTSQVTASVGFQITGASTAGRYLRHNGTRYVDAAIQTTDIPDLGANPSASVGLSAVNGVATTYLRSDSSPALSVAITPTWTGTHTFSNATYSALFSGGPVGVGIATPTAGLDIETVPASSKTFFKAGSVCPVYLVGSAAGSGSPAVGMNLYYDTAWKFGKGSSSNWGGALSFDYTSGTLAWYISSAAGTAAGAATLASIFSISAAGVVKVPGLTASAVVLTNASSDLTSSTVLPYVNSPVRTMSSVYTSVGNVGTGDDDLITYTLPGGTLASDGDRLIVRARAATTTAANGKSFTFYVFGTSVFSRTDASSTGSSTVVEFELFRVSSTEVSLRGIVWNQFGGSWTGTLLSQSITGLTLASDNVIKGVGNGTNNDDVTQYTQSVEYYAAP